VHLRDAELLAKLRRVLVDGEAGREGRARRYMRIARQVRAGSLTLNGYRIEFGAPFGGYKESGIGREFGPEGLSSFLEYKTINLPGGTAH
jgi:acyl-CoA reductase-like NAD-dependent aldehyde dehydrogenase